MLASFIRLSVKDEPIPIGVFSTGILSPLEALVKYLKEISNQKISGIARALNRSPKTIWTTYSKASSKMPGQFVHEKGILIPISVFSQRKLSVLESLVEHLKGLGLSNHEIGKMLRLDDRTIWTVYDRARKKRKNE